MFRILQVATICMLLNFTSSAYAGWKRPLGIVMTSVGGVTLIAGAIMLASPDSCRPDNQTEECKSDKRKNENNATPVLIGGAGLVAGGIMLTIFGGDKSQSAQNQSSGETYLSVSVSHHAPVIGLASSW